MIKILILILLIDMTIYDIKKYEVKNNRLLMLLILEVVYMFFNYSIKKILKSFLCTSIIFWIFYVVYLNNKNKIGGGDIKLITILTLVYTASIIYILFIASFLGIIVIITWRRVKIPFIPFLTSAIVVFGIIKWYNLV